MSLINDALRKAQRERSGPDSPGSAMPPPLPGGKSQGLAVGLAVGAALTAVVAGAVILLISWLSTTSPSPPAEAEVAGSPDPASASAAAEPAPVVPETPLEKPIDGPGVASATGVPAEPPPLPEPPAAPAIQLPTERQLEAKDRVDALRISSVLGRGPQARVMIAGKIYRPGDVLDPSLELKLERVETDRIVFTGPGGIELPINY